MLTTDSKQRLSRSLILGLAISLSLTSAATVALAAVDGTAEPSSKVEAPVAKVRHERRGGIEQVTLDLAKPAGHVLQHEDDQLIIWLDQPREFDLEALSGVEAERLSGVRTLEAGPTHWIVLDLTPGSTAESKTEGDQRLVITIKDSKAEPGQGAPVAKDVAKTTSETSHKPKGEEDNVSSASSKTPSPLPTKSEPASAVDSAKSATSKKDTHEKERNTALAPKKKRPLPKPGAPRPLLPVATASAEAKPSAEKRSVQAKPAAPLPGQFEVDEDALDRALERTLASEGVVLLPFGMIEIEPGLTYVRQEFDAPTLINLFGFPAFGETRVERNDYIASLAARIGLPFEAQLELDVPFRYVDQSVMTTIGFDPVDEIEDDTGEFGDLRVGLAKTLMKEGGWRPDVVARINWDSQTGKSASNGIALGGGSHELTGSLSLVKSQDPLAFFGSLSYEKTFEEDDLDPGDRIGVSIGTVLAASPDTSLRASLRQEFTGDAEFEGNELDGTDQMAATLSIGASSVLGRGILLDASAEVGLTDDAPDYAARISLPIRFNVRPILSSLGGGRSAGDVEGEDGADADDG